MAPFKVISAINEKKSRRWESLWRAHTCKVFLILFAGSLLNYRLINTDREELRQAGGGERGKSSKGKSPVWQSQS